MSRLKLVPKPTFAAQVAISVPGETKLPVINVVFRHKKDSEIQDWLKRGDEPDADAAAIFDEVIESWTGLADAGDNDLAYSMDALREMFDVYPASRFDMLSAYLSQLRRARGKN